MKRFIISISILLLLLSFCQINKVDAYGLKSFTVVGVSDSDYIFEPIIGKSEFETNNIAYTGETLSKYNFYSIPSHKYDITYGSLRWENTDYTIIDGEQYVNLIYHDVRQRVDIIFNIYIYGINKTVKLNDTDKNVMFGLDTSNVIYTGFIGGDIYDIFPKLLPIDKDGNNISGEFSFPDWDNTKIGTFDFIWIFTPDDSNYNPINDTIRIRLLPKLEEETDESTNPSLTTTFVLLENKSAYDINLNNKISGSKYKWTSGNPKVAKVNAKNGLVTAISEGETIVTCEITLPDNSTQKLESLVIVGYDENAPLLTETELELEVGEKFTIGVENLVKGSKISWKSSDKSIVKISSVKGKITTINEGEAYVTCTITTPQNQVIVLKCDISVTK